MRKVYGSPDTPLIELVNPVVGKWRVRWDFQTENDGEGNEVTSFMEESYIKKPDISTIKSLIIGYYNEKIDAEILSGFKYDGNAVWLSSENQFNYKSAYDLAIQSEGATLPVVFKFGTDDVPVYVKFENVSTLSDFYTSATTYIQKTLEAGWKKKDAVDFSQYSL